MSTSRSQADIREKLIAMRDASAGAFEAARRKYFSILTEVESLSLAYVEGHVAREEIQAKSEQLVESEAEVKEAARRTRIYQEALDSLPTRRRPVPKVNPIPQQVRKNVDSRPQTPAYIELKTGRPKYAHTSLLDAQPKNTYAAQRLNHLKKQAKMALAKQEA